MRNVRLCIEVSVELIENEPVTPALHDVEVERHAEVGTHEASTLALGRTRNEPATPYIKQLTNKEPG